jgi:hypothetical protein
MVVAAATAEAAAEKAPAAARTAAAGCANHRPVQKARFQSERIPVRIGVAVFSRAWQEQLLLKLFEDRSPRGRRWRRGWWRRRRLLATHPAFSSAQQRRSISLNHPQPRSSSTSHARNRFNLYFFDSAQCPMVRSGA